MATAITSGETGVDDALPEVDGIVQRPDTPADVLSKFLVNVALATEVEREDGEELCQVFYGVYYIYLELLCFLFHTPGRRIMMKKDDCCTSA